MKSTPASRPTTPDHSVYTHHLNNYFLHSVQKEIKHEKMLYQQLQKGLKQLHREQENIHAAKNSHHSHLQFRNRHRLHKRKVPAGKYQTLPTSTAVSGVSSPTSTPSFVRTPQSRPKTAVSRPMGPCASESLLAVRGGQVQWESFEHQLQRAIQVKRSAGGWG